MVPRDSSGEKPQSAFTLVMTAVLCLTVGCVCMAVSGRLCCESIELLRHGTRTMGVIVDPEQHPRVGFTDSSGRRVVFTQNGFLVRPMGASVPVIYEADDPAGTARANTIPCLWWSAAWLLPLGSVTLFGGFAGLWGWRRNNTG